MHFILLSLLHARDILQSTLSSLSCEGSQSAGAYPNSHWVRGMVHLEKLPVNRASTYRWTTIHTHIYTSGQFHFQFIRPACLVQGRKPTQTRREHVNFTQKGPSWRIQTQELLAVRGQCHCSTVPTM